MSDEHELSDYLLGEASEQERLDLERRMEADPLLRDRVRRLEAVTDQLAALPGAAWDVAVDDRTEAAGAAERPPAGRRARRPLFGIPMPGFAVALVAVALFAAGLGTGALIIRGGGAASSDRRGADVATADQRPGRRQRCGLSERRRSDGPGDQPPAGDRVRALLRGLADDEHSQTGSARIVPCRRSRCGPPEPAAAGRADELPIRRHLAAERQRRNWALRHLVLRDLLAP